VLDDGITDTTCVAMEENLKKDNRFKYLDRLKDELRG
jgi:hypothetical protein